MKSDVATASLNSHLKQGNFPLSLAGEVANSRNSVKGKLKMLFQNNFLTGLSVTANIW